MDDIRPAMRIYIAGPITGLVYEDALRAFAMAETSLRRDGHEPVNPMAFETTPDLRLLMRSGKGFMKNSACNFGWVWFRM